MGNRSFYREVTVTAQAGDWGDPVGLEFLGKAGTIDYLGIRSDAVAGTVDVKIFRRARDKSSYEITSYEPLTGDYVTNGYVDPDAANLDATFLLWSSVTVTVGTDTPSDTLDTNARYLKLTPRDDIWIAVKGVAGDVKITITGEVSPRGAR